MNFERGQDPVKAIGIGKEAILKEISGIIVSGGEAKKWRDTKNPIEAPWFSATGDGKDGVNVVIEVENGHYEVIKSLINDPVDHISNDKSFSEMKGPESELFDLLKKFQENFRKYGVKGLFVFPSMQRVAAKTIAMDLVPVQPMSAPSELFSGNYKYKKENIFVRIFKNIKKWILKEE